MMPRKAPHPCAYPGCNVLVYQGSRCEVHAREQQQRLDAQRPTSARRGYDAAWRKKCKAFLLEHPMCIGPFRIHREPVTATDVDHITPKKEGGTDEDYNLQSLCHKCHSRKTALEDGRWGRGD
jgi:5-methylcytosine-specific restriction protein A